ncbi:hypothetical protein BD413DRAFT_559675 [Trametes elegans]|nr:hypothetical protein BD413DRAFT_559675 [Trametes elegans]
MPPELKRIEPKTPRWEPSSDPNSIIVPGLDTTAPVYDQIEQIEHLITLKLQNIDANFSGIQHVMAKKILPAVKRYAVGTQPVREAAKFWTTFYEQAAQIRIPTYDDYGATPEPSEQTETETATTETTEPSTHSDTGYEADTPHANRTFNPDGTSSEVSFAPQAAISSTPATARTRRQNAHHSFTSQGSDTTPSWTASLESPLMQLNRDIQNLGEDPSLHLPSTSRAQRTAAYDESEDSEDVTQRPILPETSVQEPSTARARDKGKGREQSQPLLQNVLRRNANTSTATTSTVPSRTTSPLKVKPKTPVLKTLNPYLPPDSHPSDWKGVVDLSDPATATPRRTPGLPASSIKLSGFQPSTTANAIGLARARTRTPPPTEDESFDENFGMSPPVMTDYARLPTLGRTPKREAAEKIMKDLLAFERREVFVPPGAKARRGAGAPQTKGGTGTESSMSSIPTPPSMTRYAHPPHVPQSVSETSGSVVDASLDSIMRRVGLNVPGYSNNAAPGQPAAGVFQPPTGPVFSSHSSISSIPSIPSYRSAASYGHAANPPVPEPIQTPQPQYDQYDNEIIGQGGVDDLSSDSLDYDDANNTANPSGEFLVEPHEQVDDIDDDDDDDSFDSSMGDEDTPDDTSGVAPDHPFFAAAQEADDPDAYDDDSFDDSGDYGPADGEEETVFGVPPAQRLQQQQLQQNQLRMMGEDLLQDTIGIGSQMAIAGRVDESPTPWGAHNGSD